MMIEQVSGAALGQAMAFGTEAAPALMRQSARADQEAAQELRAVPAANASNETRGGRAERDRDGSSGHGDSAARPGAGRTLDIVV